jgi:hypothetical protein
MVSTTTSSTTRPSPGSAAAGAFLEASQVHENWYGTPRDQVREALAEGRDVILKIDVQGAAIVKGKVPGALLIFIVPPSLEDLFQRLRTRATETADELELRQRNARDRAGAPGRLRLRRDQRDRQVETDGRADRRDHRRRARRHPSGGRGVLAVAVTLGLEAEPDGRPASRQRRSGSDGRGRDRRGRARGDRTYTYRVPGAIADLEVGEAVWSSSADGRRSGSCGRAGRRDERRDQADRRPASVPTAAAAALTVRCARWIAEHYLAPPALVLRAMLPPACSSGSSWWPSWPGAARRMTLGRGRGRGRRPAGAARSGPRPVRDLPRPMGGPVCSAVARASRGRRLSGSNGR